MNGGSGLASRRTPFVTFSTTPPSRSTRNVSPVSALSAAPGQVTMGRPTLIALR